MFSPLEESIIGKAKDKGIIDITVIDVRSFAKDKHKTADDTPYGGGAGMVMKPELIFDALGSIKKTGKKTRTILLSPSGRTFDQEVAKELAKCEHLIFICGHYEGVDERVKDVIDEEISVGDYVLTGGEIAAMAVIDALSRFIPGVLGDSASSEEDSFSGGLLEYPQYTKPGNYLDKKVPDVLMGGNHKKIAGWRRDRSIMNTFFKRPDLLPKTDLTGSDRMYLENIFTGGD